MDETMWVMLSSEWFDARTAQEMGIVWRVCPDASLRERTAAAAASIAAHDPASVAATKRLLTAGRPEIARRSAERELGEMARLAR
jgi:enoyl-CoA hydratase/carnithine racemase